MRNMMDSLLVLVAQLLGILLGVHDVAVAAVLSFLRGRLHFQFSDFLSLEMTELLVNREGEDVSVNISLSNLPLNLEKMYC